MWFIVALVFSNNQFYGHDAVPTGFAFKTESECKYAIQKIKDAVGNDAKTKTKMLCVKVS